MSLTCVICPAPLNTPDPRAYYCSDPVCQGIRTRHDSVRRPRYQRQRCGGRKTNGSPCRAYAGEGGRCNAHREAT